MASPVWWREFCHSRQLTVTQRQRTRETRFYDRTIPFGWLTSHRTAWIVTGFTFQRQGGRDAETEMRGKTPWRHCIILQARKWRENRSRWNVDAASWVCWCLFFNSHLRHLERQFWNQTCKWTKMIVNLFTPSLDALRIILFTSAWFHSPWKTKGHSGLNHILLFDMCSSSNRGSLASKPSICKCKIWTAPFNDYPTLAQLLRAFWERECSSHVPEIAFLVYLFYFINR